ncbi:hypothetical protein [Flavobacterium sp. H122]|uniref:hypothetical protein n=1 Tax=Flavobacterium sp. H122 TaxID=2529860 RepID=UPI0010AB2C85|nr:hypothetical protein [Flavobacterium sp. H122]
MKLILYCILFPIMTYANMANPWIESSSHSVLYGTKNCDVIKENIFVTLHYGEFDKEIYPTFKIKYIIESGVNQTTPLLFIGIGLSENKSVSVNHEPVKILPYNDSQIRYIKNEVLNIDKEHLIYFIAKLKKGINIIEVFYDASLGYSNKEFKREYELQYSLYPSKFWRSFGPITLQIPLKNEFRFINSNIGLPKISNGIAEWKITNLSIDTIQLVISKKYGILSEFLFFLSPSGIAFLFLILAFYFHLKLMRVKKIKQTFWYSFIFFSMILLIPILFFIIYYNSFHLIGYYSGQSGMRNRSSLLIIFTFPLLLLFYAAVILYLNQKTNRK